MPQPNQFWNLEDTLRQAQTAAPQNDGEPLSILVQGDDPDAVKMEDGAIVIENADGTATVNINPGGADQDEDTSHDANLADKIGDMELSRIAQELLTAIEADNQSRKQWLDSRARGRELLALKLEEPRGDIGSSSSGTQLEGMSQYRDPLLLEAVLRFQANARGELLPADGPVKVINDGQQTTETEQLAESLEDDFNHYLTVRCKDYYPDTDRMLFYVGADGCAFKKVFRHPIKRRPVSESVDANDLIVSDAATDMHSCGRVTHKIMMRPAVMKRMQLLKAYRDVPLTQPNPQPDAVQQKTAEIQGISLSSQRPEDKPYTIYECYCELDIKGFEHKEEGEATGMPLPYRVVLEKDSQAVLEVRRNWREDDEDYVARLPFVKYPFVPGLGFYDIGLVNMLGNTTAAMTAARRELLDAGMYASFPGFIYAQQAGRQKTNEFRIPPGGGVPFDTGGMPLSDSLMAVPYRDGSPTLVALCDGLSQSAQRLGGTAEINVGEGRQDAPVGTTIALIEQATKPMEAVHKRLHAAQAEEFQLMKDLFREHPEDFWRGREKCAAQWDEQKFLRALDLCQLVPVADPNTPSHMHRMMKVAALQQMAAAKPQLYNPVEVDRWSLAMMKIDDPDRFFAPPQQQPGPDPLSVGMLALKAKDLDIKEQKLHLDTADKAAERKSKQDIATLQLAREIAVHPESQGVVGQTLQNVGPTNGGLPQ